ncbi:hypothetical protein [Klebsiella quasipneumoniae]
MMNPVPWLQMTNMISYQGLVRTFPKIDFAGYMQADIIIVLATNNPQKHLKALAQLNEFLEFYDGGNVIRRAQDEYALIKEFVHHL